MNYPKIIILILSTLVLCSLGPNDKPKVLIIGDSISIGYTPFVKQQLEMKADVFHNPGNAQHTGTGLNKIKSWIGKEEWDIIQFNWGLWDLCYRHPNSIVQGKRDKVNGNLTFSLEEYAANLDAIVRLIKEFSDAKLIFVTTTYVPEKEAGRFKQDAAKYNEVAIQIMNKHQVLVNDIYTSSEQIHKILGKGTDDVHYRTEGYKELGKLISNFFMEHL